MPARVLVIDNYDSFVYNLVQELGELGAELVVYRHDAIDVAGIAREAPDGIVLSPGPGRPEHAGICLEVVHARGGTVPILGVCLGHQVIAQAFGASIVRAPALMHGKTSEIHHRAAGIFEGLDSPLVATRYHSLVVTPHSVPAELVVTASTADGVVMGLEHTRLRIQGVQFHPESILTSSGPAMLANFLAGIERGGPAVRGTDGGRTPAPA